MLLNAWIHTRFINIECRLVEYMSHDGEAHEPFPLNIANLEIRTQLAQGVRREVHLLWYLIPMKAISTDLMALVKWVHASHLQLHTCHSVWILLLSWLFCCCRSAKKNQIQLPLTPLNTWQQPQQAQAASFNARQSHQIEENKQQTMVKSFTIPIYSSSQCLEYRLSIRRKRNHTHPACDNIVRFSACAECVLCNKELIWCNEFFWHVFNNEVERNMSTRSPMTLYGFCWTLYESFFSHCCNRCQCVWMSLTLENVSLCAGVDRSLFTAFMKPCPMTQKRKCSELYNNNCASHLYPQSAYVIFVCGKRERKSGEMANVMVARATAR